MSQSATPATQNNTTTCLETSKKEKFCSFPQRHGEATGKPETRDETRAFRARLPPIFTIEKKSKRKACAASPLDTARPQEKQRVETRHVGAAKRAFRATCSLKIGVFPRVFLRFLGTSKFATSKSMFCARLPSIFNTSHKMPRLPRNLHLVAAWRSPANAIRKQHATRHV